MNEDAETEACDEGVTVRCMKEKEVAEGIRRTWPNRVPSWIIWKKIQADFSLIFSLGRAT